MNKFKLSVLSLALIPTLAMNAGDNVKGGVDKANLDVSVAPGEDFYQYATGGWQKNNPLDPQYARFGTFDELAENNRAQIKDLILNLDKVKHEKGSVGQKVNDLFKLGMDSVRRFGKDSIDEACRFAQYIGVDAQRYKLGIFWHFRDVGFTEFRC